MAAANQIKNPIQVFLNTKQFIRVESRPAGGGNKDFFEGNNNGFERHKIRLRQDIQDVATTMQREGQAANFLVVQMREDALAKSYRPLSALFTPSNKFALVGGGRPGEMFFQCTSAGLLRLGQIIEEKAELLPREVFNKRTGKVERRVSSYRSELGAIDQIRRPIAADRIKFSAQEASEWLQQPGIIGGYMVEFFRPDWTVEPEAIRSILSSFKDRISALGGAMVALPFSLKHGSEKPPHLLAFTVHLLTGSSKKQLLLPLSGEEPERSQIEAISRELRENPERRDFSVERHQELLDLLGNDPLVRSVELPPHIEVNPAGTPREERPTSIPPPNSGQAYPVVGIIDGGVAQLDFIDPWKAGEAGIIDSSDRDEYHGTFIAGLLAGGRYLNPLIEAYLEPTGCRFFDLDVIPRRELMNSYYASLPEFLDQLETLIERAKAEAGVRVFNLSLGMPNARMRTDYSPFAASLDEIALRQDVLFVVSAGNLNGVDARPSWPPDGEDAITMLATRPRNGDQITAPAEHLFGITVGAVNPPGLAGHEAELPTTYTRRGPGAGSARKPELCHFGGARPSVGNQTGLYSVSNTGQIADDRGTSFAAPLVSATIAAIDHTLDGVVPRETLLALPIHRAQRADAMQHKSLKHIAREFVGFGIPPFADNCLADDPYSVSLVFSERLHARRELDFIFTWPRSLVAADGKCRGQVDLTLAYTPPVDAQFHSECLRTRLEAVLYQLEIDSETGEEKPQSRLKLEDSGLPQHLEYTERYLVENGLKWTPIKRYHLPMPRGRGKSSDWRLSLKSYTRAGATFPDDGVPFTIVMTISDPKAESPIYDEVRNEIIRRGLELADITVAHRLRVQ